MINVYYQTKNNILYSIENIEQFKEQFLNTEFFPHVVCFDKIEKYLIEYRDIDDWILSNKMISKNDILKNIKPFIRRFNTIRSSNNSGISAYFKGYDFDYCQKHAGKLRKFHVERWLNAGYKLEVAKIIAENYYNDMNYIFDAGGSSIWQKIHWTKRGYSNEEAEMKISEYQLNNSKAFAKSRINNPTKYLESSTTSILYWMKRCSSEIEAKEALKNRQTTFSLDKCISKFGDSVGLEIWESRQTKWQNSINNRSPEEYLALSKSKGKNRDQMVAKFGEEKTREIIKSRCSSSKFYSRESYDRLIYELIIRLFDVGFREADLFHALSSNGEYSIWSKTDKRLFNYDFTIPSFNIIIEYHGEAFHANPTWNKDKLDSWKQPFSNCSAYDSIEFDEKKRNIAINNEFKYVEVWSSYSAEDISNIIEDIIDYVNNNENRRFI